MAPPIGRPRGRPRERRNEKPVDLPTRRPRGRPRGKTDKKPVGPSTGRPRGRPRKSLATIGASGSVQASHFALRVNLSRALINTDSILLNTDF
jgi:hypothetical protein